MVKKIKKICPKCKRLICAKKLTKSVLGSELICHTCLFFENIKIEKQISHSDDSFFKGSMITLEDKKKASELVKVEIGGVL